MVKYQNVDFISSYLLELTIMYVIMINIIIMYNEFSYCKLLILYFYYYFIINISKIIFVDIRDICVLPPNIPEFEVECSFVIFVSSTLLGGNRNLVWSIIARNIVEICIGNIVTCKNFEHFWLIKSFSTYISRKIMRDRFGEEMEIFLKTKGINNLKNMVNYKFCSNKKYRNK